MNNFKFAMIYSHQSEFCDVNFVQSVGFYSN